MFALKKFRVFVFLISTLLCINVFSNTVTELLGHNYEVHSVSYSNDGKLLASGSGDTTVIVWDTKTKKPVFTINEHKRAVYGVAFSKLEKNILATGSSDGHLIMWDVNTKQIIKTLVRGDTTSSGILSLDFSPYANLLAVSYMDGSLVLYNTKSHSFSRAIKAHPHGFAMSVKFSSNGKMLVTAGGIDSSVKLFRTEDLALIYTFGGQNLSNDQVTHKELPLLIQGHSSINQLQSMYVGTIWDASFSPDGKTIASVNSRGELSLWELGTVTPIKLIKVSEYLALTVNFSKDGQKIYVGIDAFNSEEGNYVKIIDTKTIKIIDMFEGHKNRIRGMAISPDGKSLATASWDETVKIWDL